MMCFGKATTSSPSTTPNTMASSGYQSPPAASVRAGSSSAGMHARGQGSVVAERSVVDEHAAPTHPAPVDGGVGVGEERRPPRLDQREQAGLQFPVRGRRGEVPGDQVIGDGLPRTLREPRVGCRVDSGELDEGGDEAVELVGVGGEAQQVRDQPGLTGITGRHELVETTRDQPAQRQVLHDPFEHGGRSRCRNATDHPVDRDRCSSSRRR